MQEALQRIRVQIAGAPDLSRTIRQKLYQQPGIDLLKLISSDPNKLVTAAGQAGADILLLELESIKPFEQDIFSTLESIDAAPAVVLIVHDCEQDMAFAQQQMMVKATLLYEMTTSPLLIQVLKGVAGGCMYFAPPLKNADGYKLSKYELCVLRLMAVGLNPGELARQLNRSQHSIYTAQRHVRRKLGVDTNEQALVAALRYSIVGVLTEPEQDRAA